MVSKLFQNHGLRNGNYPAIEPAPLLDLPNIFRIILLDFSECSSPASLNYVSLASVLKAESTFWFATAAEISPTLAALKYLIWCTLVMEVYANIQSSLHTSHESDWRVHKWPNGQRITYISHCLSMCHRIISSGEKKKISFSVCQRHTACGIIDYVEIVLGISEKGAKISKGKRGFYSTQIYFLPHWLATTSGIWQW